jgi:hypothetical protein
VYLEHGRVELDNYLVENAIRPTALSKKNWLFAVAETAWNRSAVLHTVIETCRCRGLDPYAYLKHVLTRLPAMTNRQVPEITPAKWAKAGPFPASSRHRCHSSALPQLCSQRGLGRTLTMVPHINDKLQPQVDIPADWKCWI